MAAVTAVPRAVAAVFVTGSVTDIHKLELPGDPRAFAAVPTTLGLTGKWIWATLGVSLECLPVPMGVDFPVMASPVAASSSSWQAEGLEAIPGQLLRDFCLPSCQEKASGCWFVIVPWLEFLPALWLLLEGALGWGQVGALGHLPFQRGPAGHGSWLSRGGHQGDPRVLLPTSGRGWDGAGCLHTQTRPVQSSQSTEPPFN